MICSVAYATDDSGSDDRIGSARSFGSVECSAFQVGWLRPSRIVFTIAVRVRPGLRMTFATRGDSRAARGWAGATGAVLLGRVSPRVKGLILGCGRDGAGLTI